MKYSFPKKLKKTRPRALIFTVLAEENRPLTANDIESILMDKGEPLWSSTIYRVLEDFTSNSIVCKSTFTLLDSAVYMLASEHHHLHYALCKRCKKTTPLDNCPIEGFYSDLKSKGFELEDHDIQIYGYCKSCREESTNLSQQ